MKTKNVTPWIGPAIRDIRKASGLSMRDLAEESGVSPKTIERIERGEAEPTIGIVERILAPLGHDLDIMSTIARAAE